MAGWKLIKKPFFSLVNNNHEIEPSLYIDSDFKYEVLEKTSNEAFQAQWVEIHFTNAANIICGVIYRQHNSPETFLKYFEETVENLSISGKPTYIMSDTNLNLLHFNSCNYV